MEHEKIPTLCASCEFCGDAAFPSVQYFVGGELKARLVGFSDRPNGAPVEYPARHCEHEKLKDHSLKGFYQMLKLIVICIGTIFVVSELIDKNPYAILTGLGAGTAILVP